MKRTPVYRVRAKMRRPSVTLISSGKVYGRQLKFFTALLHMSANDHRSTMDVDFGVTNKF